MGFSFLPSLYTTLPVVPQPHFGGVFYWSTMHYLIALILLCASAAHAGEWQVNLVKGSTTQSVQKGATQNEAWRKCTDAIAAQPASTATWRCQTPRYVAQNLPPPPPPPAATGTATVSWTPPTQNTDGTPLTDLAGYRIRYGTSSSTLTQSVTAAAGATSALVGSLPSGSHYFAVVAYTASGLESAPSQIVSKAIP